MTHDRSPYAEWFNNLDPVAAAEVTVAKLRMEQGNLAAGRWFRGVKKHQQQQQQDMDRDVALWRDYRR